MGLLGKLFGGKDDEGPSLAEAWEIIGRRLGLQVDQRGEKSIAATGMVRGRHESVSIEGRQVGTELLRVFATTNRNPRSGRARPPPRSETTG